MRISRYCSAILPAALLAAFSAPVYTQRVPENYSSITFLKVAPEKADAFIAFSRNQTKKVMETRLASGGIKGWSLLKLTAPYATGAEANFAVVTYSSSYPELDPAAANVAATYQKAGVDRAMYLKTRRELSTAVSQQITRAALRVGAVAEVGDFVRVDYHSTPAGRTGELFEIEETVYAPMFKSLIEEGKGPRAWSLTFPVLPLSSELGYNFFTTQIYKDSASLGRGLGLSQDVFRKVHPTRNYTTTMQRVRDLDKIEKVRIYRVLEMVGGPVVPR